MIQATLDFQWAAAGVSAIALLVRALLFFRRSPKRIGTDPHCHHCDYLLIGIASERCPECGTVIDLNKMPLRNRRSRLRRRIAGVLFAGIALTISWVPVQRWAGSVYWYPYLPTFVVMHDLKNGSGLPPPMNDPQREPDISNDSLEQNTDLARCAFEEL